MVLDPAAPDPAVASIKDVQKLVMVLEEGGMLTAAEICEKLGRMPTENQKRRIRAAARAAFPQVLGFSIPEDEKENRPRFDGYKLLRHCTIAEAWMAANALASLKRDITAREKLLLDEIHTGNVGRART